MLEDIFEALGKEPDALAVRRFLNHRDPRSVVDCWAHEAQPVGTVQLLGEPVEQPRRGVM